MFSFNCYSRFCSHFSFWKWNPVCGSVGLSDIVSCLGEKFNFADAPFGALYISLIKRFESFLKTHSFLRHPFLFPTGNTIIIYGMIFCFITLYDPNNLIFANIFLCPPVGRLVGPCRLVDLSVIISENGGMLRFNNLCLLIFANELSTLSPLQQFSLISSARTWRPPSWRSCRRRSCRQTSTPWWSSLSGKTVSYSTFY